MTPLQFSYDKDYDILTIEGIAYAGGLFRAWAEKLPLGKPMWIEKRDGGLLTVYYPSAEELRRKADEMTPRVLPGSRVFLEGLTTRVAVVTAAGMSLEYHDEKTLYNDVTRYFPGQEAGAAYYIGRGWGENRHWRVK